MTEQAPADALQEILLNVARFFTAIDMKDWHSFAAVISDDVTFDVSGVADRIITSEDGIYRGREAVVAWAKRCTIGAMTVHQVIMPQIEILSPDRAKGTWTLEDRLRWPDERPVRSLHGYGHTHDTYVRENGIWKIASQRLTRIHVDLTGDWAVTAR